MAWRRTQTSNTLFRGDGPWLTVFPFPFPGVADSREWTHPVPDRAGGSVRRPFQASRHCGLASDSTQRAAQCRYAASGLWGQQASLPSRFPCAPSVLEKSLLTPFPSFFSQLLRASGSQDQWQCPGAPGHVAHSPLPILAFSYLQFTGTRTRKLSGGMNYSIEIVPGFI